MTENKLQLNADKTETMLFNSSKLKHPPAPLSICQATISFSDSVRNLGFYLDKDLSMKDHISFICKTAFPEIRRVSTIRHHLTDDATKTLVSLVLSRIEYCNSLMASLPQSLVGKLQRVQNCAACLVVRVFTLFQYPDIFTGCPSEPEFLIRLHASVSTPSSLLPLLISLTFYICTLLLDLFALVPTSASQIIICMIYLHI